MDLQLLAKNARRLRKANGFTQGELAGASGISLPAIKQLEGGKVQPRMNTVQSIARALKVPLQDYFKPVRELKTVRFRSKKRLNSRDDLLVDIGRWLDDFNFLEDILDERIEFGLHDYMDMPGAPDIQECAEKCRAFFGLKPTEPIHDICGLLEDSGIKLFPVCKAADDFFGLSVGQADGGPAIVVNEWERISVERRIFSAAHELGHLILHRHAYDVRETGEVKKEEEEANLFAGYFLMPEKGFQKEWEEASGLAFVDRVFKVKRIFRVSYKAVLVRLIEQGKADKEIWKRFNIAYQRKYRQRLSFKEEPMALTSEPFRMERFDFFEDRLSRLTRRAVEADKISLSRGAEILRITIEEMKERLEDWEAVS